MNYFGDLMFLPLVHKVGQKSWHLYKLADYCFSSILKPESLLFYMVFAYVGFSFAKSDCYLFDICSFA